MRTLEEYVAMIPAAPPADIDRYLDALGRKPLAITSYRCISRDDAESRLDCEDSGLICAPVPPYALPPCGAASVKAGIWRNTSRPMACRS